LDLEFKTFSRKDSILNEKPDIFTIIAVTTHIDKPGKERYISKKKLVLHIKYGINYEA